MDKHNAMSRRHILRQTALLAMASTLFPNGTAAAAAGPAQGSGTVPGAGRRILITGSSTGLGQMAARLLIKQGHRVVLHGRSAARATDALKQAPGAEAAVHGDFTSLKQVRTLANQVNDLGAFDTILHNAGIGDDETSRTLTEDGFPIVFGINVLAPYVLTALIQPPKRLIYMTSGMQLGADGETSLSDLLWVKRRWQGSTAYAESKLLHSMLAFWVARRWQDVQANTVEPGWVATRMGGPSASDDLGQAHLTQSWLAVSDAEQAKVTGKNFYHMALKPSNPDALKPELQDVLVKECGRLSDVHLT